jgi:hypothetical protein
MSFHFEPAKRVNTPLTIGLAGPTKSGKTLSALRLAVGLAQGGPIAMINAEGPKGHQYADQFDYLATEIQPPYRPARYTEVLQAALAINPAVAIIDSMSHMHDGPGGMLEFHDAELDRLAGQDFKARQRSTWSAWIKPKADENEFIYTALGAGCHIILCFRAKEKLRLVRGKDPENLGYQAIASDRITFETLFTLLLPPHCKGVPDLALSEMREPFDTIIPAGKQLSEETGAALAAWAAGGKKKAAKSSEADSPAPRTTRQAPAGEQAGPSASDNPFADQEAELFRLADILENGENVRGLAVSHKSKETGEWYRQWLERSIAGALKKVDANKPAESEPEPPVDGEQEEMFKTPALRADE